jgi:cytidylate kinase/inosine/xanthosine triphosphate pyrophosphatase family protein
MIELVFFTSSRVKLAHAIYLSRDYDVQIVGFREKTFGANYTEPRIYDREQLIERSYDDALQRWIKHASADRFFFIEDTSVTIHALSRDREIPGVDIKYWMAEMDFVRLDGLIRAAGNDRAAVVRSDLILHLPSDIKGQEKKSYRQFTSMVTGRIVSEEQQFPTNPTYPWLDNTSFNKWFAPGAHSQSISTLQISEADRYDFRAGAFREMLEYLEGQKKITRKSQPSVQANFGFGPRIFILSGPSCAGKTTLASYLGDRYGYYHVEASDFMYRAFYRRHGTNSRVSIDDFAEQALVEEPEIVARQILENINEGTPMPVIVTGFRSAGEIEWFRLQYSGNFSIETLYVTAEQSIRYERSVGRARESEASGRAEFLKRDEQQQNMGLRDLCLKLQNETLSNNGSLAEYFSLFENRYSPERNSALAKAESQASSERLEDVILLALNEHTQSRQFFTTTEIAELIKAYRPESPKNKNNISRFFNQLFYPYFDIKIVGGKRKYRLSTTGQGKARILRGALVAKAQSGLAR